VTFLQIALHCIQRGWFVFPCKPKSKEPQLYGAFHNASTDESQIRDWWSKFPNANVAIALRKSGLAVLDCDHGNVTEADFRTWAAAHMLPETYTVRTGRRVNGKTGEAEFGTQMYYAADDLPTAPWVDGAHGGEVRCATGHVMAAGSVHPDSGELYEVLADVPIVPAPSYVRNLKAYRLPVKAGPMEKIPEGGGRHAQLTSVAGKLRVSGLDADAIHAALIPINEAICADPVSDADLEHIAQSVSRYAVPEPEIAVVIGSSKKTQPEPAKLPERVRPVYPIFAWDETVVADFAKLCGADNNIPLKMYAEAFRCVLGAVVGDRLSCPSVDGGLPRTYTVIVAPKGKGKGTAIRRAVRYFNQPCDGWSGNGSGSGVRVSFTHGLLSGERDFEWKPKGIGAHMAAASSVPGMARLCRDLDSTIKNKPQMTWGNTLPRVLSVHEEMKTFLSTLFIVGGVGSGMEGVVCQLWDDVTFHGTATGTRDAAYGEMMFSMLCGVTEEDWFDLLSRGNAVGSGLMSRFNIIGTEGGFENVSKMKPTDFTQLQSTFLPRVMQLEDAHVRLVPSSAAEDIICEWADNLPEGSERMNVHAWRNALLIAWLRHETVISAETAQDAVNLGQYQIASHEYYRTSSADNAIAKVQGRIIRALDTKGPMKKRELQKVMHAERDGTELWNRALDGFIRDGRVGKREDGTLYLAA
jgi:hypothetical protein